MSDKHDTVDLTSVLYDGMKSSGQWDLISALMGDTQTMRDAKEKFTPKFEAESPTNYDARLNSSFLYNIFKDTTNKASSKPFSVPATVEPELKDDMALFISDVDGTKQDLTSFASNVFKAGVMYGLSHILVDYPSDNNPMGRTAAQDTALMPVFSHVLAPQLFAWEYGIIDGNPMLTEIRIKEVATEKEGTWGSKQVDIIRVLTPNRWQIWRKEPGKKEYDQSDEGINTLNKIPLVTFYTNRTGFMTAVSPILQLAWMNLAHWQSYSDQRNILHYARVPFLFGSGFSNQGAKNGLAMGSTQAILETAPEAKLGYVEPTGTAIDSGRTDLMDLETRMEILSMLPFIRKTGNKTATEAGINESQSSAEIQRWIRNIERMLEGAYEFASDWVKKPLPNDFKVNVYSDFVISQAGSDRIKDLILSYNSSLITAEEWRIEAKRTDFLGDSIKIEDAAIAEAQVNINEGDEE